MFRLFRRQKKDKKKEKTKEEKVDSEKAVPPQTSEISEDSPENFQVHQVPIYAGECKVYGKVIKI